MRSYNRKTQIFFQCITATVAVSLVARAVCFRGKLDTNRPKIRLVIFIYRDYSVAQK